MLEWAPEVELIDGLQLTWDWFNSSSKKPPRGSDTSGKLKSEE
jgi:hypothetical protein